MKELLIFVLLGLLVAAPGEVLNQILARHNVQAFRSTMISYTVLLLIGYFVGEGISSVCKKSRSRLIYYLLFGFLGVMVEWFLLGNAPVLEPFQIITQPGMFTYGGTMLLAAWAFPPRSPVAVWRNSPSAPSPLNAGHANDHKLSWPKCRRLYARAND